MQLIRSIFAVLYKTRHTLALRVLYNFECVQSSDIASTSTAHPQQSLKECYKRKYDRVF